MNKQADRDLEKAIQQKIKEIEREQEALYDVAQKLRSLNEQKQLLLSTLASLGLIQEDATDTHDGAEPGTHLDLFGMRLLDACRSVLSIDEAKALTPRELRIKLLKNGWSTKSKNPDNLLRNSLKRFVKRNQIRETKKKDGKLAYKLISSGGN